MCCFSSMKGVLVVRVAGLLLVASQFSSCAWLFHRNKYPSESSQPRAQGSPGPKPSPGPDSSPKPQPDPEPKPDPQPQAQPPPLPPTPPVKQTVPTARAVPGKPGYVFSPFNNKVIDVEGIQSGRLAADPTYPLSEKKYFRVP